MITQFGYILLRQITNAFPKQVQYILEVYFITKFLMYSKYTENIQI